MDFEMNNKCFISQGIPDRDVKIREENKQSKKTGP
jgi:hypothetical protein